MRRRLRHNADTPLWLILLRSVGASMFLGSLLFIALWNAPACAADPIATGRDAMRCVATTFAADMGPWSVQAMTDKPTGPAMQSAVQACGVLPYITVAGPDAAKLIYSGALAYWMIKD